VGLVRQRRDSKPSVASLAVDPAVATVTVLICSWRRPAELCEALSGVLSQTRPADQILVVVRPDDTPSREVLARSPEGVREVLVERPGISAARNAGLAVATGDVVFYLDDDAVPHPNWIQATLRHYESDSTIGAVGGRDLLRHATDRFIGVGASVGVVNRYGRFIGLHHTGSGTAREVDFLKGANMSFRRQWFPDLRPESALRGDGIEYHEETSIALAIKHLGYKVIYDPQIKVDHNEGRRYGDQRSSPAGRALFDRARNRTYLCVKYMPAGRSSRYLAYSLLVGSRDIPGLFSAARRVVAGESPRRAFEALVRAAHGHLRGLVEVLIRPGRNPG
jgi:GT2 family glycosyltransferase